ncbi:SDR family NAD(P)-dependent oxidoreductase [SAR92 clade bacterium H246]
MNRVDKKVAMITGAASGIGKAAALLLSRQGADVVIADIDREAATAVAADIEKLGGEAATVNLDVACPEQWDSAMDTVLRRYKKIDILVNNAGVVQRKDCIAMSVEDWLGVQRVNYDGVFIGMRSAIKAMRQNDGLCSIINISSVSGLGGYESSSAYCASKGGVRILSKALAVECARYGYGIRVNSICPGTVVTPLVESFLTEEQKAFSRNACPMGILGDAEDIAKGILFLASDDSRFITGVDLIIDGGVSAAIA